MPNQIPDRSDEMRARLNSSLCDSLMGANVPAIALGVARIVRAPEMAHPQPVRGPARIRALDSDLREEILRVMRMTNRECSTRELMVFLHSSENAVSVGTTLSKMRKELLIYGRDIGGKKHTVLWSLKV